MEVKKYEYIDSLRGIAVLMVLVVHVANFFKVSTTEYFPDLFSESYIMEELEFNYSLY